MGGVFKKKVEPSVAQGSKTQNQQAGRDGDAGADARRDSASDFKLRSALTTSDISFLHAHECYVDKSTLQDKSDMFQVRRCSRADARRRRTLFSLGCVSDSLSMC